MCHFSENILDSSYVWIGLLIFVRFSWDNWLYTRLKIIEIIHTKNIKKNNQNNSSGRIHDKNTTTVFVVDWSKMTIHFLGGVGSSNIENCTLIHTKNCDISFPVSDHKQGKISDKKDRRFGDILTPF